MLRRVRVVVTSQRPEQNCSCESEEGDKSKQIDSSQHVIFLIQLSAYCALFYFFGLAISIMR